MSLGTGSIVARRWRVVSLSGECVFDGIVDGSSPAHVVLDREDVVGFLDARPVFPGHTLIVTRTHWQTIAEVPAPVLGKLLEAGRAVADAQRQALGADGTFFGLNDVVSQSVPHVHLHVVPRRRGDGLRGFFWPRSRYSEGEAEKVAQSIREALSDAVEGGSPS
jgi:histidine triad (HIT) family protein